MVDHRQAAALRVGKRAPARECVQPGGRAQERLLGPVQLSYRSLQRAGLELGEREGALVGGIDRAPRCEGLPDGEGFVVAPQRAFGVTEVRPQRAALNLRDPLVPVRQLALE